MTLDRRTTRLNYDRLSRWYDMLSASSERAARTRGLQLLDVQSGARVLEIGCGTGESLAILASCTEASGRVIGIDLSAGMLSVAKNKLGKLSVSNIALLQADTVRLPFPNGSFDAIFMSFTLELFSATEIPIVLQECKRLLCSGGQMGIVALLKKENPGWLAKSYTWMHHHWPTVIDCRPIALEEVVKSAGFEIPHNAEMSMWGLAVGILVAVKMREG